MPYSFSRGRIRSLLHAAGLALLVGIPTSAVADPSPPEFYRLDTADREPRTDDPLANEGGTTADGTVYSATRNGFYRNGKAWYPVAGEMHYLRCAPETWDAELAKLRAGGLDVVATYVIWNHHEAPEGVWNWSGNRDVRRFLELAQKHGLKVWLRVGPYCNAEAKNGGLPDFARKGARTNDPVYLAKSEKYLAELSRQIRGMFAQDGGPIIGMQLENEFASGDPKHITRLREIFARCGMRPIFHSVTANTRFEKDTAIPLQGGYVYRGWESGAGKGAMSGFIFGSDEWTANTDLGGTYYDTLDYPRGYCELGPGSPMRGHERFLVEPDFIAATACDAVGRGSNFIGYYMFHGGTQVPGLNDGWPLTYDFQAPIGEFGRIRETYRRLRRLHEFLRDYAPELLATRIVRDRGQLMDPKQTGRLRHIARLDKDGRGFVFISNIQRNLTLPDRKEVRIEITSPAGKLLFPETPLTVPSGRFGFFPIRTDLGGGAELTRATVEPMGKLLNAGETPVYVYRTTGWTNNTLTFGPGCEIVLADGRPLLRADASARTIGAPTGTRALFSVRKDGREVARVVTLPEADSLNAFTADSGGKQRLFITDDATRVASVFPYPEFMGRAGGRCQVDVFPASELATPKGWEKREAASPFIGYVAGTGGEIPAPSLNPVSPGVWKITFDHPARKTLAEARLDIAYAGGEAKLLLDGVEYSNDLWHDETWSLDLLHFRENLDRVTIQVFDWDKNIKGAAKPEGPTPAISNLRWDPLVRVPFLP